MGDREKQEYLEWLKVFKKRMLEMRAREDRNKATDQAAIDALRHSLGLPRPNFSDFEPIDVPGEPISEMLIRDRQ